jgi:PAS domain S-box-containing protein
MTSAPEPAKPIAAGRPALRGQVREQVFRLLVETVQDYAIFLLAPDGHVLTWNPGAQRAKGYTADEIIGQHFSVFYTPDERNAGRPASLLRQAAEHGRIEDVGWRVRKDGTRFWADVVLTALRDADGGIYAYAKITRDLTEQRDAEEQRRNLLIEQRARAAAEEAIRTRDRFLSIASHELKTPVATLQLSAESILRARDNGRLDDARLDKGLRRIVTSTHRLGELVDELLDVSMLTSGRTRSVLEPTDVVSLLGDVIARLEEGERTERIRLAAPARITISADASRLDQVFTNLVDNALKYSPPPDPVDVRVVEDAEGVEVSVTDRGIGFDEPAAALLFEAFSRGQNAEHVPGLGLGLYICQRIVDRHGGRIRAEPGPDGRGSVFSVWLPKVTA